MRAMGGARTARVSVARVALESVLVFGTRSDEDRKLGQELKRLQNRKLYSVGDTAVSGLAEAGRDGHLTKVETLDKHSAGPEALGGHAASIEAATRALTTG
jgi:erythromycin esterase-like protein